MTDSRISMLEMPQLSRIYQNPHFWSDNPAKRADLGDPGIGFEIRSHHRAQFDDAIKVAIFYFEDLTRFKSWSFSGEKPDFVIFFVELYFSRFSVQLAQRKQKRT